MTTFTSSYLEQVFVLLNNRQIKQKLFHGSPSTRKDYPELFRFYLQFRGQSHCWAPAYEFYLDKATAGKFVSPRTWTTKQMHNGKPYDMEELRTFLGKLNHYLTRPLVLYALHLEMQTLEASSGLIEYSALSKSPYMQDSLFLTCASKSVAEALTIEEVLHIRYKECLQEKQNKEREEALAQLKQNKEKAQKAEFLEYARLQLKTCFRNHPPNDLSSSQKKALIAQALDSLDMHFQ